MRIYNEEHAMKSPPGRCYEVMAAARKEVANDNASRQAIVDGAVQGVLNVMESIDEVYDRLREKVTKDILVNVSFDRGSIRGVNVHINHLRDFSEVQPLLDDLRQFGWVPACHDDYAEILRRTVTLVRYDEPALGETHLSGQSLVNRGVNVINLLLFLTRDEDERSAGSCVVVEYGEPYRSKKFVCPDDAAVEASA